MTKETIAGDTSLRRSFYFQINLEILDLQKSFLQSF